MTEFKVVAHQPASVWDGQGRGGWWPKDPNERTRLWVRFQATYRGQGLKDKGKLTQAAATVFRGLLFDFLNLKKGACFPSYETIAKKVRLSRRAVASALQQLRAYCFLTWERRRKVVRDGNCVAYVQHSNAYSFVSAWLRGGAECKIPSQTPSRNLYSNVRWIPYVVDKCKKEDQRRREVLEDLRRRQPDIF